MNAPESRFQHPALGHGLLWLGALLLLVGIVTFLSPLVGSSPTPIGELFEPGSIGNEIFQSRLVRVTFGLLAGLSLAMGGVVFQAILRNDLAEPYILGVSGGATLGALICLRTLEFAQTWTVPAGAFLGATLTVLLIYGLARMKGSRTHPTTLLLAGVTLNILFGAFILFVQFVSEPYEAFLMIRWMMGGLDITNTTPLYVVGVMAGVVFLVLLWHARAMNLMTLGDDTAQHLGVNVERTRIVTLAAASLLTAAVVAYSGPIGFVGLIVPHIMRFLVGPDHRLLIAASALFGAAFLVLCDTVARTSSLWSNEAISQLPVGIITAALGAPFFLVLLFAKRN